MEIAQELLKMFTAKTTDIKNVLSSFQNMIETDDKNIEKLGVKKTDLTRGKNIILRHLVNEQIAESNQFRLDVPFGNPCNKCKGAGELYKFTRKKVKVTCNVCEGECQKEEPCQSCNETGIYTKSLMGDTLRIKVECKTCKGSKIATIKCRRCKGEGEVEKTVLDKIESTTPCDKCKGRGYFPVQEPVNPAMPATLGNEIKTLIVEDDQNRAEESIKLLTPNQDNILDDDSAIEEAKSEIEPESSETDEPQSDEPQSDENSECST